MDQSTLANDTGLEDQLRGMILGNVRIGNTPEAHRGHHGPRGRGRGRGRGHGAYWRGGYHPHAHHGNFHGHAPPSPGAFRGRGRGNSHHDGRRQQQQQHTIESSSPAAPSLDAGDTAAEPSRQQRHSRGPGFGTHVLPPNSPRAMQSQHEPIDHAAPGRGGPGMRRPHGQLYHPRPHFHHLQENTQDQIEHLETVAQHEIPLVEMGLSELEQKEAFRVHLEHLLRKSFAEEYSGDIQTISLVGFGSLASGFGIPGSDMDLAVVPHWKDAARANESITDREIPRLLERAILNAKMGGRLLTRTRVPILKVCQEPTESLYTALFDERKKWDDLPDDEKYPADVPIEPATQPLDQASVEKDTEKDSAKFDDDFPAIGAAPKTKERMQKVEPRKLEGLQSEDTRGAKLSNDESKSNEAIKDQQPRAEKTWVREKALGPLDFPKTGCGIQCDLNFGNPLGIWNTRMLRCYSLTDPRVRPIVLFVKSWAKRRKINSAYSGTLSSYGWVLMVLHYLVNIAQPAVCPNLQQSIPQPEYAAQLEDFFRDPVIDGYKVRFWSNEDEIMQAAQEGKLSQNRHPIGALLRGFFQYFASLSGYGPGPRPPQFYWTSEVLSLRTHGGLRTKQEKGWVSAKTTVTAEKKVTNRYLFAIEDPFEIDHNVARTVTHRGIVAIRDEFRRAWRILKAIGEGTAPRDGLFDEVVENLEKKGVGQAEVKSTAETETTDGNNPVTAATPAVVTITDL